jgi:beta-N-acetylhexosaminidase
MSHHPDVHRRVISHLLVAALALAVPAAAAATPLHRLVGETVVTALAGPPRESFLAQVRDGDVGGVILVGHWASRDEMAEATRTLQAAACERGTPLLFAVDQEGGPMRRMPWAAPAQSARSLGDSGAAPVQVGHVQSEAHAAAAALRRAGIAIDFAPVADTQLSPASFLGSRTFSTDPTVVGRLAAAFVRGLQAGGVAATAKHFPGLGAATLNTDDHVVRVQRVRLQPFRDAIAAGVRLVMMSNASYPHLDPSGRPAVFSRTIVTKLLRGSLGFDGVVVTDALDAPTPNATAHAPARAIGAGVDLLLYTSGSAARRGYESLLADAAQSSQLRAQVATAVGRIRALKSWLGVAC